MKNPVNGLLALGIGWSIMWMLFGIAVVVGWVMNIIDLIGMNNVLSTGEGIVRVVGIFLPPLGAFMGFFF